MTRTCTKLFLLLITALCPLISWGQSATVSPYSRYGIGELENQIGAQGFAMGNTGIAMSSDSTGPYFIDLKNPASCYYNRMTTFEAGVLNNNLSMSSNGQKENFNNTYFSYFAVAFPLQKWGGFSFGIMPMSSVGYDILTTSPLDSAGQNIGTLNNEYSGAGGINRVFGALAVSPIKNLSLGINASYLFGNITNAQSIIYPLNYTAMNGFSVQNVQVKDFYFTYGLMYTINLPADWHITIGGTAGLNSNIKANYTLLTTTNMNGYVYDTIQDSTASGHIRLPLVLGGGLTIKKGDKWTLTFDYTVQNWSQYSFFGEQQSLSNSTQWGAGLQYVPDKKNEAYYKRIYYRAGFAYNQTYLDLKNTQVNDYAVSLGVGFPVGRNALLHRISVFNIGVQYGQYGTTSNNLLKENYFKFLLSFTFNDRWFQKRLYE